MDNEKLKAHFKEQTKNELVRCCVKLVEDLENAKFLLKTVKLSIDNLPEELSKQVNDEIDVQFKGLKNESEEQQSED